jgi:hypothetical protein
VRHTGIGHAYRLLLVRYQLFPTTPAGGCGRRREGWRNVGGGGILRSLRRHVGVRGGSMLLLFVATVILGVSDYEVPMNFGQLRSVVIVYLQK